LDRIFSIWDGVFKTIGIVVGLTLLTVVTWAARGLYYTNGKWDFAVIVIGGIIYVVALAIVVFITWAVTNAILVNKTTDC